MRLILASRGQVRQRKLYMPFGLEDVGPLQVRIQRLIVDHFVEGLKGTPIVNKLEDLYSLL